jgi:hypothetical protein
MEALRLMARGCPEAANPMIRYPDHPDCLF